MFILIRSSMTSKTTTLSMVFTTPEKAKSYVEKYYGIDDAKWRFYDDDGSYDGIAGSYVYTIMPVPVDPEK